MDYCLLQDVFPDWKKKIEGSTEGSISVGCTDLTSAQKARKEQKKRAKKCKDPSLRYLEPDYPMEMPDPDRPAFRRQQDVLPMSSKTGVVEARPFGNSASADTKEEGFQIPQVPGPAQEFGTKRPKYFGASEDDDVEGFAPYTNIIGDDPAYRLSEGKGAGATVDEVTEYLMKFGGGDEKLPAPNLEDAWKPITPPGAPTAFFQYLARPGESNTPLQKRSASPAFGPSNADVSKKLDEIFSRLDQLEQTRNQSSQTEVLLFVGTGILLLGSLELICRRR